MRLRAIEPIEWDVLRILEEEKSFNYHDILRRLEADIHPNHTRHAIAELVRDKFVYRDCFDECILTDRGKGLLK